MHQTMEDRAFAWVLGAGASVASGIPTGAQLVDRWLGELHEREHQNGEPVGNWATAANLGITGFDYAQRASFYPRVFQRRFGPDPDEGYACLESLMADKDPSPGYSILARIIETTRHRVVITTNFDNLVADALAIYTAVSPLVCGHESLASFVRPKMRRPVVCKIHRDLLLGPQNDPASLSKLSEAWVRTLTSLFGHYTPIFVGYGGNDDSLMGMLEKLAPADVPGRSVWCYYKPDGQPPARIRALVAKLKGVLVPCPGFDKLMLLLGQELGIAALDQAIETRAKQRADRYRERLKALSDQVSTSAAAPGADTAAADVAQAMENTLRRAGGWWAWAMEARKQKDPAEAERIYRLGISQLPTSAPLVGNFALFLKNIRKNHDEAERLYRRALELDPNHANNTGNFAFFLTDVRKNHDEAERLYRRALELDPNHAGVTGSFAVFMTDVRKNHDEAERLYRRALELDPNHANNTANFACFLLKMGRMDGAAPLAARAWELNATTGQQAAAEAALYRGLISRLGGQSDESAVGRLKSLLAAGYTRGSWSFNELLAAHSNRLRREANVFYRALADAILDESKVAALERFDRWRSTRAIPPTEPWPA
jgi:Tfp pilus assembly protein PilF